MELRKKRSRRRSSFDALESRELLTLFVRADSIVSTSQASFSGEVAFLVDSNLFATPSSFNTSPGSVQINWGDGSATSSGEVVGTAIPGFFEVDGTHTFTQLGSFTTQVTVTDQGGNSASGTGLAVVTVTPLTITPSAVSAVAGTQLSLPVANFVDTNASDTMNDFNALIEWGDGQSSTGAVVGGNGAFTVVGTHTYSAPGTYSTTVTVVGLGSAPSGSTTGQANISSVYRPAGTQLVAVAGQAIPSTTALATFIEPAGMSYPASNFTAAINWGDGGTSAGTVVATTAGNFAVEGGYTYNIPGSYTATVTISNTPGKPFTATDSVTVANSTPSGTTFSFSGQLSSVGNGQNFVTGYTNTNQPTFIGTAPPFSTVELYAKPHGIDTELPLGEAVSSGAGQWILTTGPLSPGTYTVSATVTPSGGYPSAMMLLVDNGIVHIDVTPKHAKIKHTRTTQHPKRRAALRLDKAARP
jgi:Bacterial Ig-like domain